MDPLFTYPSADCPFAVAADVKAIKVFVVNIAEDHPIAVCCANACLRGDNGEIKIV